MNSIKTARTFMPEILAPGTGLSPVTNKSVIPTNNVTTIQDILEGKQYKIPGAGGDWSSGEDVSKSYKDEGDAYKRQERDLDIFKNMLIPRDGPTETWKVRVPGGSKEFSSFELANLYKKKLTDKGIPVKWMARTKQAQVQKQDSSDSTDRVKIVADTMAKTFMVETLDFEEGFKLNGAAFCVSKGYFITCAHVIRKYNKNVEKNLDVSSLPNTIKVSLIQENRKFPVQVIAMNAAWDIALLKGEVPATPFKLETEALVGEEIMTIGSPHGFENNVSFGSVGGLGRKIYSYENAPDYMFVDLAAFTGNSGGPVIKQEDGSVIAMLTAIVSGSGEYGLNAGLPAEYIKSFCIMNNIAV